MIVSLALLVEGRVVPGAVATAKCRLCPYSVTVRRETGLPSEAARDLVPIILGHVEREHPKVRDA